MDFANGEMMPPPLDFTRRFAYDGMADQIIEVERETTGPLMTPLMNVRERIPKMLSPVAKALPSGSPAQAYGKTLPDPDIARIFIAQYQNQTPNATAPVEKFPYKLRAVGRVNAMQIFERAGQPGELVSPVVQLVP